MYIGRKEVLLTLDVQFRPSAYGDDIVSTGRTIEASVRQRFPVIRRIDIEAGRITGPSSTRDAA